MRVLIDTNIFLDILLQRDELKDESLLVLKTLSKNKDEIYVNASTLKDIYYFAKKLFHNSYKARLYIDGVYSRVTKIISLTSDDAISSIFEDGDYEDNCLIESAKKAMCDAIITRNVKDFNDKEIPIFSPEQYLSM